MAGARFIYRVDDVVPGMNHAQFRVHMELFRHHGVVPLLGVVPDNQDPTLNVDDEDPAFWERMARLVADGQAEIAQHGYQHLYDSHCDHAVLGPRLGFSTKSEFAGHPYELQRDRIEAGQSLLRQRGLSTDVWMAPSHTFDRETLRALRDSGFRHVTDGISLYPVRRNGLTLVPQQLWEPKRVPFGVWTICLHPNTDDRRVVDRIRTHLESDPDCLPFSQAARLPIRPHHAPLNLLFRAAYAGHIARHRLRARRRVGRTTEPNG